MPRNGKYFDFVFYAFYLETHFMLFKEFLQFSDKDLSRRV